MQTPFKPLHDLGAFVKKENRLPNREEFQQLLKSKAVEDGKEGAKKLKERYGDDAHRLIGKLGAQKRWANHKKRQKLDKSKKS